MEIPENEGSSFSQTPSRTMLFLLISLRFNPSIVDPRTDQTNTNKLQARFCLSERTTFTKKKTNIIDQKNRRREVPRAGNVRRVLDKSHHRQVDWPPPPKYDWLVQLITVNRILKTFSLVPRTWIMDWRWTTASKQRRKHAKSFETRTYNSTRDLFDLNIVEKIHPPDQFDCNCPDEKAIERNVKLCVDTVAPFIHHLNDSVTTEMSGMWREKYHLSKYRRVFALHINCGISSPRDCPSTCIFMIRKRGGNDDLFPD